MKLREILVAEALVEGIHWFVSLLSCPRRARPLSCL